MSSYPMDFFLAQTSGNAAGWFAGFGLAGLLVAGLLTVFWLWMLIDALTNASLDSTQKIVWAAVIFFFPFIGAVVYFFVARKSSGGAV
jgi:Phospholipase_D-nuclease N-terminal